MRSISVGSSNVAMSQQVKSLSSSLESGPDIDTVNQYSTEAVLALPRWQIRHGLYAGGCGQKQAAIEILLRKANSCGSTNHRENHRLVLEYTASESHARLAEIGVSLDMR